MKKIYALVAAAAATMSMNAQLYVVGNGDNLAWDPAAPMVVNAENGQYKFTITNLVEIKMSSAYGDWDTFNAACLYADFTKLDQIGQPLTLEINGATNFSMPYTGDWTIVVSGDFTTATCSTTTPVPPDFGKAPVAMLRGDMNGWANDEAVRPMWTFTLVNETDEAWTYYFDCRGETMIPAGQNFKIGDAGWGTINYGNGGEIEVGEEMVWNHNAEGGAVAEDYEGTIEFVFDRTGNKAPALVTFHTEFLSGISNIAVDNSNAPVEYFNLQGVRVANPENGVYIRRQGNKATKVLVK